ncbi:alpha-amylase family glycosyl hydrolase [Shewanella sp. NIFS-20-20]|uniref:alpha-amylase family glycosyl hydrolase n=1 Tax=Shewanella sp. NIFS-20-20 TaxID=2853806 RepID=UPI001C4898A2|nr:alpha-amylase family glycosyl hydrolase [Shewanella sp. NIFS-20-20]MBV7315275.1 alpha-amylase [Shewanella sp. NIFS-20-20]
MKYAWMFAIGIGLALTGYTQVRATESHHSNDRQHSPARVVIYQIFTRVFANQNTHNQPWGTLAQNGSGKFNDINDAALASMVDLGVTHVWYTGVLHHASVSAYREVGIETDDPDVVKGRAGSPYAVRDYFNVDPDLAVDPRQRLAEFSRLVKRSQRHGLKVIIDLVPNHVARNYRAITKPEGVRDLGADDDTSQAYARDNNFYYIARTPFAVPQWRDGYQVLAGENHADADGQFVEMPAKWTGNGSREPQPDMNDWYETVKLNYGVRPDGHHDFATLPANLRHGTWQQHYDFWQDKQVPNTWIKFRQIAEYWLAFGVDGFRFDVAELVPVEFWSYLNSAIKHQQPEAFLLAEVYQPQRFRDYLDFGQMDALYNKVDLYDALKAVIRGEAAVDSVLTAIDSNQDIEASMLNFLENHDEQRIAHPDFSGDPFKALPAMTLAATIGRGPVMVYFAQELGEAALADAGYGKASRTTIFDYWGLASMQGWINGGRFDSGGLSKSQRQLRQAYRTLLTASQHPALQGQYQDLHRLNRDLPGYDPQVFSYARWQDDQRALVLLNFSAEPKTVTVQLPSSLVKQWHLRRDVYELRDLLSTAKSTLAFNGHQAELTLTLAPYGRHIWLLSSAEQGSH